MAILTDSQWKMQLVFQYITTTVFDIAEYSENNIVVANDELLQDITPLLQNHLYLLSNKEQTSVYDLCSLAKYLHHEQELTDDDAMFVFNRILAFLCTLTVTNIAVFYHLEHGKKNKNRRRTKQWDSCSLCYQVIDVPAGSNAKKMNIERGEYVPFSNDVIDIDFLFFILEFPETKNKRK